MKNYMSIIGKMVTIKDSDSMYNKEWGIVKLFDGDYFHVALWGGNDCIVLERKQFTVNRV